MLPEKFIITGNPMIKKNSRNVVRNKSTGRMFPIKSKRLNGAESDALGELEKQKRSYMTYPYAVPLHVRFMFYRGDRRGVDLSNLYEFAQDVLQEAGIITNDVQIESHDGSRKLYDKQNPRTEIYIAPFTE